MPGNIEPCVERRYFSQIHYLALVCDDNELARRLQARPAWRGSGNPAFIDNQIRFNRWFNGLAEGSIRAHFGSRVTAIEPGRLRLATPDGPLAIGNDFVAMIKDSALVSTIAVQELLWRASQVGTQQFRSLEALLIAAGVYWVLTIVFSFFQERLETRMARGDR